VGYYRDLMSRLYVRARHYHGPIGRWLSRDPLGFAAFDWNLFRYVKNRPVYVRDPSGMIAGVPCAGVLACAQELAQRQKPCNFDDNDPHAPTYQCVQVFSHCANVASHGAFRSGLKRVCKRGAYCMRSIPDVMRHVSPGPHGCNRWAAGLRHGCKVGDLVTVHVPGESDEECWGGHSGVVSNRDEHGRPLNIVMCDYHIQAHHFAGVVWVTSEPKANVIEVEVENWLEGCTILEAPHAKPREHNRTCHLIGCGGCSR